MLQEAVNEYAAAVDAYARERRREPHHAGSRRFNLDECFEEIACEQTAYERLLRALDRLYHLRSA